MRGLKCLGAHLNISHEEGNAEVLSRSASVSQSVSASTR